ncbi:ABC transporter ATP-binding protein [Bacillus aquiflavi]|uniref:ABC transporter ATP-binding protein n=1 Tax=Bacillus aquiflavi TaxID=2672567 RepID=A0A6B3VT70_9BACI|nr:ABC transporter ATP-binding protein [Bacillus aquiflavi]MBA4536812.1 ABC transporter ATP-binding protein [Bacillus aquiflavi]NEY81179.1 ABC transporter ATP-binding protein [Bacillus aquiflavi]UAC49739.1 ABC transporter ATP-binding protein [Bacillus aquiflavi]
MILSVNQVHKSYGKEKVLNDITFEIETPKIVALIGPNGSGKSTLLSIITNLLTADKGEIFILNKSNKDPEIFKEVSFMQDNSVLYDYLTGYDHCQFIGDVQKIPKQQMIDTAERIGITSYLHKKVGNYSLGMKQHLLLTMALLNQPKLLILDEPLNGLDPTSAIKVRKLLLELLANGTTIILSSHQLLEIDLITSHILFLKNGRLIKEEIPQHEKICYQLTVNHLEKAQYALEKANIPVKIVDRKLILSAKDCSISKIFRMLDQQQMTILDIEKKMLGSEDRYQKIFGHKEDT